MLPAKKMNVLDTCCSSLVRHSPLYPCYSLYHPYDGLFFFLVFSLVLMPSFLLFCFFWYQLSTFFSPFWFFCYVYTFHRDILYDFSYLCLHTSIHDVVLPTRDISNGLVCVCLLFFRKSFASLFFFFFISMLHSNVFCLVFYLFFFFYFFID